MNNKVLAILFFFSLVSCGSNSFQNKLEKDSLELVLPEQPKLTDEELRTSLWESCTIILGKWQK